jgi:hypothetical protein
MELESTLLCSKVVAICPYPEPDESGPYHPIFSMLRGPHLNTAWRVLRLQIEETASRHGG